MKQIIVYSLSAIILLGSIWAYFFYNTENRPQPIATEEQIRDTNGSEGNEDTINEPADYKAIFLVYTNGTRRDFSAAMYRNQSQRAFINENQNTINVRQENTTWGDFFDTLPLTLTRDCLITGTGQDFCSGEGGDLRFYLNGNSKPDLLDTVIQSNDQALISFGQGNEGIERQLEELAILADQ